MNGAQLTSPTNTTAHLSASPLAPSPSLTMNHNSGAFSVPEDGPIPTSFFHVSPSGRGAPETDHNGQETGCAPPQNPVTITGHRALLASLLPLLPSPFLLPHSPSLHPEPLQRCARTSPANLYACTDLSERIPLRSAPPLSVSCRPHSFLTRVRDVGDSAVPTAVGNNGTLAYIWSSGCHQPAHSQSLRLGNQGISGDSRLYFALSG